MEEVMTIVPPEDQEAFKRFFRKKSMPDLGGKEIQGFRIIPGFDIDDEVEYAYQHWSFRKNDVLIASFPKTGTNWLSEIVRLILYQDDKVAEATRQLPFQFFLLENGSKKKFEFFDKLLLDRRCMSTHLPSELINMENIRDVGAKVIYLLRNPKDQIVSWKKFAEKIPQGNREPWKSMLSLGWDKYFDHVTAGDFEMNTKLGEWYPEHILSWYKHKNNQTVYFVHYEDLKKNTLNQIQLLAQFLVISLSEKQAEKIKEKSSFDSMLNGSKSLVNKTSQRVREINMRKGQVGDWKEYFVESQSTYIENMMEKKLEGTDIKFIYDL